MLRLYLEAGWSLRHVKGSHHRVAKGNDNETIPVHGNKDLGKGLESKLLKHLKGTK